MMMMMLFIQSSLEMESCPHSFGRRLWSRGAPWGGQLAPPLDSPGRRRRLRSPEMMNLGEMKINRDAGLVRDVATRARLGAARHGAVCY